MSANIPSDLPSSVPVLSLVEGSVAPWESAVWLAMYRHFPMARKAYVAPKGALLLAHQVVGRAYAYAINDTCYTSVIEMPFSQDAKDQPPPPVLPLSPSEYRLATTWANEQAKAVGTVLCTFLAPDIAEKVRADVGEPVTVEEVISSVKRLFTDNSFAGVRAAWTLLTRRTMDPSETFPVYLAALTKARLDLQTYGLELPEPVFVATLVSGMQHIDRYNDLVKSVDRKSRDDISLAVFTANVTNLDKRLSVEEAEEARASSMRRSPAIHNSPGTGLKPPCDHPEHIGKP